MIEELQASTLGKLNNEILKLKLKKEDILLFTQGYSGYKLYYWTEPLKGDLDESRRV